MPISAAGLTSKPAYQVGGPVASAVAHVRDDNYFSISQRKRRLLEIIKQKSLLTEGGPFKLASGVMSDYYLDMKPTMLDPEGSMLTAEIIYDEHLKDDPDVDSVGGLELGAVPIIATICARSWHDKPIPGFVVRKEKKGHGTDKRIDGNFRPNTTVILFDDVTTKGGSVMQAVRAVRAHGAVVKKIITVVDRLEGAKENLLKEGIALVPIFTTDDLLRK
jgi:orotate phosphoribosyltransferase